MFHFRLFSSLALLVALQVSTAAAQSLCSSLFEGAPHSIADISDLIHTGLPTLVGRGLDLSSAEACYGQCGTYSDILQRFLSTNGIQTEKFIGENGHVVLFYRHEVLIDASIQQFIDHPRMRGIFVGTRADLTNFLSEHPQSLRNTRSAKKNVAEALGRIWGIGSFHVPLARSGQARSQVAVNQIESAGITLLTFLELPDQGQKLLPRLRARIADELSDIRAKDESTFDDPLVQLAKSTFRSRVEGALRLRQLQLQSETRTLVNQIYDVVERRD